MSTPPDQPDELEGTEQPFVSHLVELRDRLVRSCIAIGICFGVLTIWPGPATACRAAGVPELEATRPARRCPADPQRAHEQCYERRIHPLGESPLRRSDRRFVRKHSDVCEHEVFGIGAGTSHLSRDIGAAHGRADPSN